MPTEGTCAECGAALPANAPGNRCPKCLLGLGLQSEADKSHAGSHPTDRTLGPSLGKIRYFGDYELLEEIARGGMGVVYKARQVSLNRLVAVKMILAGEFASAEFVQRFRKEAKAAANLHHPNIVAIHEVGVHERHHYFSMDYVEGKNLADLARGAPLSARQAANYLKIIAEAIHYAHQRGTLHRDLKPSNVLIDEFNEPRVTDFGLAKQIDAEAELTPAGQILGSPSFTPPEQAAGRVDQIEARSDVYGLGAILFYLLSGRPPFVAETMHETVELVQYSEPLSLRALNPGVPRDLETICLKCLQKRQERRYPTASDLAQDLERFLRNEPIRARPVNVAERAWRWCRREPTLAQLATTVVISVLALIVGLALHAASVNRERLNADRERLKAGYASALLAQLLTSIDGSDKGRLEKVAKLWNTATGKALGEGRISLDRRSEVFAASTSNAVQVCDSRTGQMLYAPLAHPAEVTSVAFSSDGRSILTVCADVPSKPGAAYLWEATTGKLIATLRALPETTGGLRHAGVREVAFSPDGRAILMAREDRSERAVTVVSARFSQDGRFIITVTTDFRVQVWDARTGETWKPSF